MFDSITIQLRCPYCGKEYIDDDCQTKDLGCYLANFEVGDQIERAKKYVYLECVSLCPYCSIQAVRCETCGHTTSDAQYKSFKVKVFVVNGIITGEYESVKERDRA